ncbi:hypothetical protein VTN31DRAFT_3054 [Thermomyces dupontii]|uniref:uncharacterized protein n=1 Tax=Talaromyces thermophilus TaxID=28565 RepID=UPI003743BD9B
MKLLSVIALLAIASPLGVSAASLQLFPQAPVDISATYPVSGDNPLEFCSDPSNNILEILNVDLSPNPPQPGQTLSINAEGILHETVERGAKVLLQVSYGLIRLISQEVDLCDQLETNVDISCPLEKGKLTFTKQVDLPKEIPPGKYSVIADAYTKDKQPITCLQAKNIVFH